MNTLEGCAAAYDAEGNLLFYSDGDRAWNRDNQPIAGAVELGGHGSSTQSAVVVRQPLSCNRYYLFTAEVGLYQPGTLGRLYYAVFEQNMTTGAVSMVVPRTQITDGCEEKLTAIPHANGEDVWILGHRRNSNVFVRYLLTKTGLGPQGTQAIGSISSRGDVVTAAEAGVLRSNFQYTRVVNCLFGDGVINIFDFNNTTGLLATPRNIVLTGQTPYGAVFSPNGQYLYTTTESPLPIRQYDLTATNLLASQREFGEPGTALNKYGDLQLGPDGRIYVAQSGGTVHRINTPDARVGTPAFQFQRNAIVLPAGTESVQGLPNFFPGYQKYVFDIPAFLPLCPDLKRTLIGPTGTDLTYSWRAGSNTLANQVATTKDYTATGKGKFYLEVRNPCGLLGLDSIELKDPEPFTPPSLGETSRLCLDEKRILSGPESPDYAYRWYRDGEFTGITTRELEVKNQGGLYRLEVTNGCGATVSGQVVVEFANEKRIGDFAITPDPPGGTLCELTAKDLIGPDVSYQYEWRKDPDPTIIGTERRLEVDEPGTYSLTLRNGCNAKRVPFVLVPPIPVPAVLLLGDPRSLCQGQTVRIFSPYWNVPGPPAHTWRRDGTIFSSNPGFIDVNQPGTYQLEVNNGCGSTGSGSVTVTLLPQPVPVLAIPDVLLCAENTADVATLTAPAAAGALYSWIRVGNPAPLSTSQVFTTNRWGNYQLTLTNACGVFTQVIRVFGPSPIPEFDLGPDDILCADAKRIIGDNMIDPTKSVPVGAGFQYEWTNKLTGERLADTRTYLAGPGEYRIVVRNGCGLQREDDIKLTENTIPGFDLGVDVPLCGTDSYTISGPTGAGYIYTWKLNGASVGALRTVTVDKPGRYSLTVSNGCAAPVENTVEYLPATPPPFSLGPDDVICVGESYQLVGPEGQDAYAAAYKYRWYREGDLVSEDRILTTNQPGNYQLRINRVCNEYTADEKVLSYPQAVPALEMPTSGFICPGSPKQIGLAYPLPEQVGNPYGYAWKNEDGETVGTTYTLTVQEAGLYTLTVADKCGNTREERVQLTEPKPFQISPSYWGNVFTPNNDGMNDEYPSNAVDISQYRMKVFDRWGTLVHEGSTPWRGLSNGADVPEGAYLVLIEYIDCEGNKREYFRTLTIVR